MEYASPLWRYKPEQMGLKELRPWPSLVVFPLRPSDSLTNSDESCILLTSPTFVTYYRAIVGPSGLRPFQLEEQPSWSQVIYGQTKALLVEDMYHSYDTKAGRVSCCSYANNLDKSGPTLRFHGEFPLHPGDLASPHQPRDEVLIEEFYKIDFDEESGRICFVLSNQGFGDRCPAFYDIVIMDFV